MILTDDEKRMRDGAEGAATAAAMDLLIRYGDALGCDRLCDVRNVAGAMTQPSPVKERLVREGGWDKAFAVINLDCDTVRRGCPIHVVSTTWPGHPRLMPP